MKGQDILVLLKLILLYQEALRVGDPDDFLVNNCSVRSLASFLGISKTEVNASIRRSLKAGLALKDRRHGYPKANARGLLEFIQHGIRYVFPVKPGEITRGIPTAFDAPVLEGELAVAGELPRVWPEASSQVMGMKIQPLFKSVPFAAQQDPELYALLALVDAIRIGNPRELRVAQQLIEQKILKADDQR